MPVDASSLLKDEKFYKKLDLFLGNIYKDVIRLDEDNTKWYMKVTKGVVENVIEKLKKADPVFLKFYQKIVFVGSYYDGLRVGDATEFDFNIVLKLPCDYDKIKVLNANDFPGFVRLDVKNAVHDESKLNGPSAKEWKKWVTEDGYLHHEGVLRWWESILAKISEKGRYEIKVEDKFYQVSSYKNGPALTFRISNDEGMPDIDVDLVPVVEFPATRSPPNPTRWISSGLSSKYVQDTAWAVVPKPMDDKKLWRLSFTPQEQKIMLDLRHLKYINKMLKKFRDANKLNIPSYQIKTLFIWEAYEKRQSQDFWKKAPSYLLPYMLVKLAEALEKKELPFFWNTKMNLFDLLRKKSEVLLPNMEGNVKGKISQLNRHIEAVIKAEQDKSDARHDLERELEKFINKLFGIVVGSGGKLEMENKSANAQQAGIRKETGTNSNDEDLFLYPVNHDSTDSLLKSSNKKKNTEKKLQSNGECIKSPLVSLQQTSQNEDLTAKYCGYLEKKLNQFDYRTRAILINKINNLIFDAEMETYNSSLPYQSLASNIPASILPLVDPTSFSPCLSPAGSTQSEILDDLENFLKI